MWKMIRMAKGEMLEVGDMYSTSREIADHLLAQVQAGGPPIGAMFKKEAAVNDYWVIRYERQGNEFGPVSP